VATPEPGVDVHEWESELAALEPDLRDSPVEALPELARLVERMLEARGLGRDGADGQDPEVSAELRNARELSGPIERGEDVDPGDVASSIEGLQGLARALVESRGAP
jgi:hypothetical protein